MKVTEVRQHMEAYSFVPDGYSKVIDFERAVWIAEEYASQLKADISRIRIEEFKAGVTFAEKQFETEIDKLQKFKDYVHKRLDEMGVPADADPDGTKAHGCRIQGRLNWLERKLENLKDKENAWDHPSIFDGDL